MSENGRTLTIVDFGADGQSAWRTVDDVVMGGVSHSRLRPTGRGTAVFEGVLSLENGGGFCAVRGETRDLDLSAWTGLEIRVRGDGKRYHLRLRTHDELEGVAYRARFTAGDESGETDGWQTLRLPFGEFRPSFRGRVLEGLGPLPAERIRQVGLLIAEGQAGPFRLEIAWIRAYGAAAGAAGA